MLYLRYNGYKQINKLQYNFHTHLPRLTLSCKTVEFFRFQNKK